MLIKKNNTSSRSAKIMVLTMANLLSVVASIAFGMICARYLSKNDYATIRQTFLVFDIAAPLLMLGLPNAIYYFFPRETENKFGVVIDNIALLASGGLVFGVLLLCGGNTLLAKWFNNEHLVNTIPWLAIYGFCMMPLASVPTILVCTNRVRVLAIYTALFNLIATTASIIAVLSASTYALPIYIRIIIAGIQLPVGIYIISKATSARWRIPKVESLKRMLLYSLPLGFATMLGTLTMQLHALIVATLCTPDEFSIYMNGATEIPIIGVVTGSITSIVLSDMSAHCANGNLSEALGLFRTASIQSACILFPAMCFFFVMAEPFIVVMYSIDYIKSSTPFLMYLCVMPGRIVVYGAAMMALGMTREVMWRSLVDLIINAVLCWLLVRIFGYVGAALGLVCTIYIWTIPFNLYKLAKGFNVGLRDILPWNSLGKILVASLVSGFMLFCARKFYVYSNPVYELLISFSIFIFIASWLLHKTGCISIFSVLKTWGILK